MAFNRKQPKTKRPRAATITPGLFNEAQIARAERLVDRALMRIIDRGENPGKKAYFLGLAERLRAHGNTAGTIECLLVAMEPEKALKAITELEKKGLSKEAKNTYLAVAAIEFDIIGKTKRAIAVSNSLSFGEIIKLQTDVGMSLITTLGNVDRKRHDALLKWVERIQKWKLHSTQSREKEA